MGNTCTHPRRYGRLWRDTRGAEPAPRCEGSGEETARVKCRAANRDLSRPSAESTRSRCPPGEAARDFGVQRTEVCIGSRRQCANDHVGARAHVGKVLRTHGLEAATHRVANDRRSDLLTHDETETRGAFLIGRDHVGDRVRTGAPSTPTDDGFVLRAAGQTIRPREHRSGVKPKARCAPWRDERRGCRGRHACACGHGSRASWRDDGCWAGKCACSWDNSGSGLTGGLTPGNIGKTAARA